MVPDLNLLVPAVEEELFMHIRSALQGTNLFGVSTTQHEVGSFNVCMDVLVLMNVLQYIHLAQVGNKHRRENSDEANVMT